MAARRHETSLTILGSLHGISRALKRRAQARHGDSLALLVVLGALAAPEGARASELADQLLVDLSSVSRRLTTLETQGLVAKVVDDRDRRAHLVVLTDSGRDLLQSLRQNAGDGMTTVLAGWSQRDLDTLGTLLQRLEADLASADTEPAPLSLALARN